MSIAPLLLISFISGYFFIKRFFLISYKSHRQPAFIQYLQIGFYSVLLFVSSVLIYLVVLSYHVNDLFSEYLSFINDPLVEIFQNPEYPNQIHLLNILFINFLLGISSKLFDLPCWNKFKINSLNNIAQCSLFEELVFTSIIEALPISLTMSNGKAYVGFINSNPDITNDRKEIKLLPLVSGYRNNNTRNVEFTTFYNEVYDKIENIENDTINFDIFYIILPFNNIQSANLFNFDFYEKFNQAGTS